MAELFGRVTGCSRGRGGSMHLFAPEVGLLGTSGIVGPSIVMATGAGYSYRLLGTDRVSVAFFGDGAVNNGAFHEGLNLAAIWRLPVLFVCENNLYATEVPFQTVAGNPDVATRGDAYGLPSVRLDGNDVFAVHEAAG
jgi:2-oxoisovalerate dehydrogenase E1 component